jgi:hypothetical protein
VEVRSSGTDSGLAIVGPQASSLAGPNGSPRLLIYFFVLFSFSYFLSIFFSVFFCEKNQKAQK